MHTIRRLLLKFGNKAGILGAVVAVGLLTLVSVNVNVGTRSGVWSYSSNGNRKGVPYPVIDSSLPLRLNYTMPEWNAMSRRHVMPYTRTFCEAVESQNRTLVPDCDTNIRPELWLGRTRLSKVPLVVGMPTMLRPVKQYVKATLKKLLRDIQPHDRNSTVFLVFLGDENAFAIEKMLTYFFKHFHQDIESGLVELLVPQRSFYSILRTAPCGVMNNSDFSVRSPDGVPCQERYLRWRNKQNFDYAYMMAHGSQVGEFYLQIEDDMMCGKELFPAVFSAIRNYEQNPWVLAEVTGRGFRGKMFKSNDTFHLAQYLLRHFDEMPCDWLYPIFVGSLPSPCDLHPEKYPLSDCSRRQESRKLVLRQKDICSHRGRYSSLQGKIVPIHLKVVKV